MKTCKWTPTLDRKLLSLLKDEERYLKDIAAEMGLDSKQITYRLRRLGIRRKRPASHGKWNNKHAHLREPLLIYYLTHSAKQCQKKFNLTPSEFISCLTNAYKDPQLAHIRKDTRTHAPWSLNDWLFALQHCGLQELGWISHKMGRSQKSKRYAVKEKIASVGGGTTRFLNGMPISWAQELWPHINFDDKAIKTKSGPTGGNFSGNFRFKLIPWVDIEKIASKQKTPEHIMRCLRAMATFQRFIFQKRDRAIKKEIRKIVRKK